MLSDALSFDEGGQVVSMLRALFGGKGIETAERFELASAAKGA